MEKDNLGIAMIMGVFITIIVGVVLFQSSAQEVGKITTTESIVNQTLTATASSTQNLNGQAVIGTATVTNTSGTAINTGLYTISNNQVVNGELTATITINATGDEVGNEWYLSYDYEPLGYISGASRSIALLIPIFFALALLLVALNPTIRSEVMRMMN